MTNPIIKVGSKVVITNPERTYTTFDDMFESLGFKNIKRNEYFSKGTTGTVFAIENHLNRPNKILCAVEDKNGNQCLIDIEGVEIVLDPEDQF